MSFLISPPLSRASAELLAPRAQGKGIEIATAIDLDVPRRVTGDPDRLRQILMNLARKCGSNSPIVAALASF